MWRVWGGTGNELLKGTASSHRLPDRSGFGAAKAEPSSPSAFAKAMADKEEERKQTSRAFRFFFWIALPACASVLLLATTNKMCQEVAVIPFLWVVPLGLYLLSFIICFDSPRWYHRVPFGLGLTAVMGAVCWALLP